MLQPPHKPEECLVPTPTSTEKPWTRERFWAEIQGMLKGLLFYAAMLQAARGAYRIEPRDACHTAITAAAANFERLRIPDPEHPDRSIRTNIHYFLRNRISYAMRRSAIDEGRQRLSDDLDDLPDHAEDASGDLPHSVLQLMAVRAASERLRLASTYAEAMEDRDLENIVGRLLRDPIEACKAKAGLDPQGWYRGVRRLVALLYAWTDEETLRRWTRWAEEDRHGLRLAIFASWELGWYALCDVGRRTGLLPRQIGRVVQGAIRRHVDAERQPRQGRGPRRHRSKGDGHDA